MQQRSGITKGYVAITEADLQWELSAGSRLGQSCWLRFEHEGRAVEVLAPVLDIRP